MWARHGAALPAPRGLWLQVAEQGGKLSRDGANGTWKSNAVFLGEWVVSGISFSLPCCGLHVSEQHRGDFDCSLRSDPGSVAENTRTCLGKALQRSAHTVEALWLLEKRGNPKAAILVNNTRLPRRQCHFGTCCFWKLLAFFCLFLSWENSSYFNLGFTWETPGRYLPDPPATISLSEVGMTNCSATQPCVQHNKPIGTAGFLLRGPSQAPWENSSQM